MATLVRPSRRASQGAKVYRVDDSDSDAKDGDVVMASPKKAATPVKAEITKPSTRTRGQAALRSFFTKRAKAEPSDDDTPKTPTYSSGKLRVEAYVEVPVRRGTPGSATVASSVTRSPKPSKSSKRQKRSHSSDSDSSFQIDADEVAQLEAYDDQHEPSDDVMDDVSEVAAATVEPEEEEDVMLVEKKPKKKAAPRKSTGKGAKSGQYRRVSASDAVSPSSNSQAASQLPSAKSSRRPRPTRATSRPWSRSATCSAT